MAYKEKDTKKWTAQWFETNAKGEKKKRRKRGFSTKKEALEYERQKKLNSSRSREKQILAVLKEYGINSIEEAGEITKAAGLDKEINGYNNKDMLPEYRKFPAFIKCNFVNGYFGGGWKVTDYDVPIKAFPSFAH